MFCSFFGCFCFVTLFSSPKPVLDKYVLPPVFRGGWHNFVSECSVAGYHTPLFGGNDPPKIPLLGQDEHSSGLQDSEESTKSLTIWHDHYPFGKMHLLMGFVCACMSVCFRKTGGGEGGGGKERENYWYCKRAQKESLSFAALI